MRYNLGDIVEDKSSPFYASRTGMITRKRWSVKAPVRALYTILWFGCESCVEHNVYEGFIRHHA